MKKFLLKFKAFFGIYPKDCIKFRIPFWKTKWPFRHFTHFTYPALGLKYLEWEASLKQDDEWFGYTWREKEEPEIVAAERDANTDYMKPTPQAEHAMKIISLYYWWKNDRPARIDPHDAGGWSAYCEKKRQEAKDDGDDGCLSMFCDEKTPEEKEFVRQSLDKVNQLEEKYDQEDADKLIEIIKIRRSLWT